MGRHKMQARIIEMANAMTHRGPDDSGVWQDPQHPLALGHRRLSIIDLTHEGAQPMESSSGRYVLCYNGEIYNFQALQRELVSRGQIFRGRSDTEVILEAIEHWGFNLALQKINGMFAFVLWDRKTGTIHAVRDRLGKKPLYIGWAGRDLVFASELKSIRAHPDFKPAMHEGALALYIRYGYVPAPFSVYDNIWTLKPGHWISLKGPALQPGEDLSQIMRPYWDAPAVAAEAKAKGPPAESKADPVAAFERLLKKCTAERMVSDVPLGAFLSGGIDSSAVVAMMQAQSGQPVQTFTIGFEEAGFDEAVYAKKVADHLGTDHHELTLTNQEARDLIPDLPFTYDEPFADISALPTMLLSRYTRQHVTVALSGDGGDEMLGGYNRHVEGPKIARKTGWLPRLMKQPLAGLISSRSTDFWDRALPMIPQAGERVHKAADLLSLSDPAQMHKKLLTRWTDPLQLVKGANEEPLIPFTEPAQMPESGFSLAESMMLADAMHYLPNSVLVKVDRATMAYSLEARAPLLDRRIFEYVWRLPLAQKIRGGKGKWLLRQVLKNHLPEELFERPKQGFTIPVGAWLRGPLKDWAEDLLDEKALKSDDIFDPAPIRQAWQAHLEGQGNHADRLWTVLMFQAWKKRWG